MTFFQSLYVLLLNFLGLAGFGSLMLFVFSAVSGLYVEPALLYGCGFLALPVLWLSVQFLASNGRPRRMLRPRSLGGGLAMFFLFGILAAPINTMVYFATTNFDFAKFGLQSGMGVIEPFRFVIPARVPVVFEIFPLVLYAVLAVYVATFMVSVLALGVRFYDPREKAIREEIEQRLRAQERDIAHEAAMRPYRAKRLRRQPA